MLTEAAYRLLLWCSELTIFGDFPECLVMSSIETACSCFLLMGYNCRLCTFLRIGRLWSRNIP